jgi:hypothetical protein
MASGRLRASSSGFGLERWSVQLELGDDEIAKLYGQGLARGAVVWRKGMVEWRPLLITQELTTLLRRTRVTPSEETTLPTTMLPPAPRVPSDMLPPELASLPVPTTTVSPIAMDVAPPSKPRRPLELAAVAIAAFALAWVGHAKLYPASGGSGESRLASLGVAAPTACQPASADTAGQRSPNGSSIPIVSVADLPLASGSVLASSAHAGAATHGSGRAFSGGGAEPSRSELVGALSQVARAASGCGERGGPVRVVISFANSGVARSIRVSGQDLPSSTRSCIIGAASRARVSAFSGDPVTVGKTL